MSLSLSRLLFLQEFQFSRPSSSSSQNEPNFDRFSNKGEVALTNHRTWLASTLSPGNIDEAYSKEARLEEKERCFNFLHLTSPFDFMSLTWNSINFHNRKQMVISIWHSPANGKSFFFCRSCSKTCEIACGMEKKYIRRNSMEHTLLFNLEYSSKIRI